MLFSDIIPVIFLSGYKCVSLNWCFPKHQFLLLLIKRFIGDSTKIFFEYYSEKFLSLLIFKRNPALNVKSFDQDLFSILKHGDQILSLQAIIKSNFSVKYLRWYWINRSLFIMNQFHWLKNLVKTVGPRWEG